MMNYTFSGFSDEISPMISEQVRVLKDLSISYMEVRGVDGKNICQLTLDETKDLKRRLDEAGIKVSALGSPLGKISVKDDFEKHLELFDHAIEQAKILETSYIRLFSFYDAESFEPVKKRLRAFIDHTPSGITLLHENEKGIYGNTADRCLEIFREFEGAPLKATYDPANFIQEQEDTLRAFDLLSPYIAYMHIKDARYKDSAVVPPGQGDAGFPELIKKLRAMNYEGFFSMEPHLADFAGYKALEREAVSEGKASALDGEGMFTLAVNCFRELLK